MVIQYTIPHFRVDDYMSTRRNSREAEVTAPPNALLRLVMIGDNVGGMVLWFSPSTIYICLPRASG